MKIHHLNCATLCPLGGRLFFGDGVHRHLVCHCLLIESDAGLVLVDTGLGLADMDGHSSTGLFKYVVRPALQRSECAFEQILRLGLDPKDVRHIVVTHLDLDHAGGLPDFPEATVHVMAREYETAMAMPFTSRGRLCATQWEHEVRWQPHDEGGDHWYGFQKVVRLAGLPPEILMVPLYGHSAGHAAVAIDTDKGWVMHCGDAYHHHAEVHDPRDRVPVMVRVLAGLGQADRNQRLDNLQRLRDLAFEQPEMSIFCAHDPSEFEAMRRTATRADSNDRALKVRPIDRV